MSYLLAFPSPPLASGYSNSLLLTKHAFAPIQDRDSVDKKYSQRSQDYKVINIMFFFKGHLIARQKKEVVIELEIHNRWIRIPLRNRSGMPLRNHHLCLLWLLHIFHWRSLFLHLLKLFAFKS